MLAWANSEGVKIYDTSKNMRIAYVQRPAKVSNVCKCHLMWESVDSLLIGWSDSIKIVALKPRVNPATRKMQIVAEITSVIETPFIVCGVCPFGPHNLAVLAYVDPLAASDSEEELPDATDAPRSPVELRILNRRNGEPLSEDELPLKNTSGFDASQLSLEALDRSQRASTLANNGRNSYPTMYAPLSVHSSCRHCGCPSHVASQFAGTSYPHKTSSSRSHEMPKTKLCGRRMQATIRSR